MQSIALPTPEEAERITGYLLWRASKLWQRRITNVLKPLGIASTQFVVLGNIARLSRAGSAVGQGRLSSATNIDAMTISQTIRSLEAKGLIERTAHTGDKRAYTILPTPAGLELLQEALRVVSAAHQEFFRLKGQDGARLTALLRQLIKENSNEKNVI